MEKILQLQLDRNNEKKLEAHSISPGEIRQVLANRHLLAANPVGGGSRKFLIGETNAGRIIKVSIEPTIDSSIWRPITGWDASESEINLLNRLRR